LNIVRWFQPHVLVGGFHFMKLDPQTADATFMELAAKELLSHSTVYYTGHCTGEKACAFLKERMGDRLHSLSTGLRIVI
jgi:7,8-dihydropterin-6-yl-methyl-4-(beta-D-ribofuranosyl)aminobenzene 5'-phosphate synthase